MKNPFVGFRQYLLNNLVELGINKPKIDGTDSDLKTEFEIANLGVEFTTQTICQIINDFLSKRYPNRFARSNRMSETSGIIVFDDLNDNESFLQIVLTCIIKEGKVWLAIRATYF
ncbi:MAG: hypothetical protein UR93_C0026G0004 [Berkelbacteria bacterium GW2011_GWA2_35_9]|uniref:Uncharacterized protein n=1 Tax=Berkelbacteria bacterium GW2011_GWA2_35_9 TaxID=1618333 RepID=A0A0G0D3L6_9BACT|nr:MAG: hypothetical protein UR93_C0026G0004 [Berkelbacteria bacterium GW2011_GWA2_35_9]